MSYGNLLKVVGAISSLLAWESGVSGQVHAMESDLFPRWAAQAKCRERSLVSGQVQAYVAPLDDADCVISVGPLSTNPGLTFRQFFFRTDGMLAVHVSTDDPGPSATGTRSYFLFPRKNQIFAETRPTGDLVVRMANGADIAFDSVSARVKSISNARFIEDPSISMGNYGGFEFISFTGLLLDTGWEVRGSAFSNETRKSLFRDSNGNYCVVENTEVFEYRDRARLKFATDAELVTFLERRCPTLKIPFRP